MLRNYKIKSNSEILEDLGARIKNMRLLQNVTQANMAEHVGLSLSALKKMEAGKDVSMTTFLKCLRFLNYLNDLEKLLPEDLPSPKEMILKNRPQRLRASQNKYRGRI